MTDYPEIDDDGRAFCWMTNYSTGKHEREYAPEPDEAFYFVVAIDGRGNVREDNGDGTADTAYATRARLMREHPNWTVRVRVI
jgi:hypothetical protein